MVHPKITMDHPIKIPQETEDELKNELLLRKLETNKIKYELLQKTAFIVGKCNSDPIT